MCYVLYVLLLWSGSEIDLFVFPLIFMVNGLVILLWCVYGIHSGGKVYTCIYFNRCVWSLKLGCCTSLTRSSLSAWRGGGRGDMPCMTHSSLSQCQCCLGPSPAVVLHYRCVWRRRRRKEEGIEERGDGEVREKDREGKKGNWSD